MPDDALKPDSPLYERDFALWAEGQGRALAEGRADALDWANLAEEIESLGRAQRNELVSRLRVILIHLLKWAHQPRRRSRSWRVTLAAQRADLELLLQNSPSLRGAGPEALATAYRQARRLAAEETGLSADRFPAACPYTLDAALNPDFLPDSAR